MDANTDKAPMTIQALGILAALPLAMFALWADYLERHIEKIKSEKEEFNPELECARVRMNSAIVVFFQILLFMSSTEIRAAHPIGVNVFFLCIMLTQGWLQASTEKKLGLASQKPKESFKRIAQVLLWVMGSVLVYIGILVANVAAFAFIADLIHANRPIGFGLVCMGAILGLLAGMGFNFALAPLHLRKILPTKSFEAELPLQAQYLHATFLNHGMRIPTLFLVESTRPRSATAFISGFCSGRGIFAPALFISRSLAEHLTPPELQAVVRHEISHMLLGHIQQRFLYTAGIMGGLTTFGVACMLFFPQLSPLLAIGSFVFAFRWLGQQTRKQEIQADFYAIKTLGTEVGCFCSALRKIDGVNGISTTRGGTTHPATEFRIALLQSFSAASIEKRDDKKLAA